ncbi:EDRF1 factor, partial [Polyodon spathula]|nr:EDRF1 factor [Polyodon spathula]
MCLGSVNEVKSRAVVKYSTAPPPTTYALLQEKTDLKLPPANWLRESTELGPVGTTILGSSSKSKPFSSFGMAYDFIDSIGNDVDVVSDSENIKKLLKIPYSKSHVSMAVHRVGRTLLLDELDIQELFMRSSQTGDWNWLKEFYQRLVDQKWQRKKKSKEQWYQRAILSKFLYYSINGSGAAEPVPAASGEPTQREDEGPERGEMGPSWPAPLESSTSVSEDTSAPKQESVPLENTFALGHVSSTPKEQNLTTVFNEGESSQGLKNDFVRNILWTFEDIHMLVGTNMPIFGGGRYPAVSLRLRDNNKPINVLTGIDYWLDNLMCNVPELVMCFHVNGIVQKYEMIKTEDIPDLDNSTFSTKVVKDIAQNILSFLKSNCTKEGHTYWLFKDESCQEDFEHPTRSGIIPGSWQYKMKLQLFFKASKAYYVLSDAATNLMKYGRALRYIKIALQCHDAYCSVSTSLHTEVLRFHSQCLSLCGDIQLMLAQNASNRVAYLEEYNYQTKDDQEILHSLHRESSCQAFNMITELATDLEHQLSVSCKCYEAVRDLVVSGDFKEQSPEQLNQVLKRLGNIRNEVGVFYMNRAATVQTERAVNQTVSTAEQELWKKSFSCFEKGIKDFEAIGDATNTALLLCNTGRLMRICAQAHCAVGSDLNRGEFSPEEALYYNKAIDYYLKAMRSLVKREMHPAVWDSVNWELSTTYFTLATVQQDYAPLSRKAQEQIEREVTEAMMKSLKYCDLHTESARQPLYQYRAATIHHRLASMYHSCFRNQVGDEHLRKQHRGLAELHYNKAVKLFQILRDAPCELLRTQLERVAFAEFQMAGQSSNLAKLKTLSGALEIMTETKHAFQLIHKELLEEQRQRSDCTEDCSGPSKTEGGSSAGLNMEELLKLINVFESSLSFLLLHLVKLMTATKKKSGTVEEGAFKIYKQVYSVLLRADKTTPLITRVELILDLLDQLSSRTGGRESGGE